MSVNRQSPAASRQPPAKVLPFLRRRDRLLAGLLLPAALLGCLSAIPSIDPSRPPFAGRPAPELEALERGRGDYIAKCSGCHSLYRPSRGDAAYWNRWVGTMAQRSKLSGEERELISRYLTAVSPPLAPPR